MSRRPTKGTSLPERRARRRDEPTRISADRTHQIFAAAAKSFQDLGYHGASLADIAERAGLSRASMYYYFPTKEALLMELIREPLTENTRRMEEIVASEGTAATKIDAAIRDLMRSFDHYYPALNIWFDERFDRILADSGSPEQLEILQTQSHYVDLWVKLLSDGQDHGEIQAAAMPRLVSFVILGIIVYTSRWYQAGGPLTAEDVGAMFSKLILNGLLPR
jgi:AcrR family transcriptional regulator